MSAETTAGKQRGKPFPEGRSGNPSGRPRGARNKTTVAIEKLLDDEGETITRKAIELAKAGDGPAIRLCMDRIVPVRRDRLVVFDMPPVESAADAARAQGALIAAVAAGEITPSEAGDLAKLVDSYVKALEASEFEERLARLEQRTNQ